MAQEIAIDSTARTVAMIAGTQSGKTAFVPWWLWSEIRRTAAKEGNNDYLIITSSYDLFKLKLLPTVLNVFEHILQVGRYWAGDKVIELRNLETGVFHANKSTDLMWGRIILRSAQSLGGLESATARAAALDEAGQDEFTLSANQAIDRRLRLHRGRKLITTTLYNLGWVKTKVIDKALTGGRLKTHKIGHAELMHTENDDSDVTLIQYDSTLNPEFSQEEFEEAQKDTDPGEFAMFYRGRIGKLKTMIYNALDEAAHVVPGFKIPKHWPKLIGIDPVGAKIACLWLAYDPENNHLHVYREYEEEFGLTTGEHAANIIRESGNEFIAKAIGGGPSENQARLDWGAAGIKLEPPPISDVWAQILRVIALLKNSLIFFHDNCPRVTSDMLSMKRKKDKNGNVLNQIENKDIWHLPDALRYIVAWVMYSPEVVDILVGYEPVEIK